MALKIPSRVSLPIFSPSFDSVERFVVIVVVVFSREDFALSLETFAYIPCIYFVTVFSPIFPALFARFSRDVFIGFSSSFTPFRYSSVAAWISFFAFALRTAIFCSLFLFSCAIWVSPAAFASAIPFSVCFFRPSFSFSASALEISCFFRQSATYSFNSASVMPLPSMPSGRSLFRT